MVILERFSRLKGINVDRTYRVAFCDNLIYCSFIDDSRARQRRRRRRPSIRTLLYLLTLLFHPKSESRQMATITNMCQYITQALNTYVSIHPTLPYFENKLQRLVCTRSIFSLSQPQQYSLTAIPPRNVQWGGGEGWFCRLC